MQAGLLRAGKGDSGTRLCQQQQRYHGIWDLQGSANGLRAVLKFCSRRDLLCRPDVWCVQAIIRWGGALLELAHFRQGDEAYEMIEQVAEYPDWRAGLHSTSVLVLFLSAEVLSGCRLLTNSNRL